MQVLEGESDDGSGNIYDFVQLLTVAHANQSCFHLEFVMQGLINSVLFEYTRGYCDGCVLFSGSMVHEWHSSEDVYRLRSEGAPYLSGQEDEARYTSICGTSVECAGYLQSATIPKAAGAIALSESWRKRKASLVPTMLIINPCCTVLVQMWSLGENVSIETARHPLHSNNIQLLPCPAHGCCLLQYTSEARCGD